MQMFGGFAQGAGPRLLRVVGEGRVDVRPDTVSIFLGVSARASQASQAFAEANAGLAQVVQALLALGIPRDQIQTSQISLQPVQEDNRLVGYDASAVVRVTLRDLSLTTTVLDRAVAAGANTVQGIQFEIRDPAAFEASALNQAVQDGQRRATTLARSLGVQLGPIWRAEEEGAGGAIPFAARTLAAEAAPVLPGTLPVVRRVVLEYVIL